MNKTEIFAVGLAKSCCWWYNEIAIKRDTVHSELALLVKSLGLGDGSSQTYTEKSNCAVCQTGGYFLLLFMFMTTKITSVMNAKMLSERAIST